MSGISRLDEKHKRCVELVIRSVPRDQIAEQLGVSRSTVFSWMKDPLIQAYYEKLVADIEAARRMRLTPTLFKAVEALELALELDMQQRRSSDPAEQLKASSITALASVLDKVYRMERTDAGNPSQISESRVTAEAAEPRKRSVLEQLLDAVVVEGEKLVELEPEAKS